jgi:ligand-binding sensor domain-containing protein
MNDGSGQTVTDSSGQGNNGTLGADSSVASDDPTWSTGSPVKNQSALWVGTASGVTGISLNTQRQITYYTTANSGLPSNNVSSLGLGVGGLAIVGTDAGAWPTGQAGFPVDDTALSAATSIGNVRDKGGSIRIKGGSVRIKPK